MPTGSGFIYLIYNKINSLWIRLLWNSQRKRLKKIGTKSKVANIPKILGCKYIEIGDNFYCGNDVRIEAWDCYMDQQFTPHVSIGNHVTFTDRCHLSCVNRITIADGVLLGRDVFIADNSHGDSRSLEMLSLPPIKRPLTSKGPVTIGNNVWIGRQTTILSGVTIGDNTIIGANSVVNKNIPANCLAAGTPVKIIKIIE